MLSVCHHRCLCHPCHCHRRSHRRCRLCRHCRHCQQQRGGVVAKLGVILTKCGVVAERVCMTSLVSSPRGVASSASVALPPSVESLPSLVLSPSVSKLGVIVTERAPSGVALLPRLASSPKCGVVVAKHAPRGAAMEQCGVVSRVWPRCHHCCHQQRGDNETMFRGCWIWE